MSPLCTTAAGLAAGQRGSSLTLEPRALLGTVCQDPSESKSIRLPACLPLASFAEAHFTDSFDMNCNFPEVENYEWPT